MHKYNSEMKNNQWKVLLEDLNPEKIDSTVNIFVDQLKKDNELFNNNMQISDCAYNTPRIKSFYDKKYSFSHKIAFSLYPIDDNDISKDISIKKKWSYIQYQKLLSKLSNTFVEQIKKEESLKVQFKEVKKNNQRANFCKLEKRPISDLIINPTPMPAEVSNIDDFTPFLNHLYLNEKLNVQQLEFQRGVIYIDGRVDLCKQVFPGDQFDKLMNSLKNNTFINHFLLGNNIVGLDGAISIANYLNNDHKNILQTLYLAGNKIDSNSIKLIADALKKDNDCEALWLKRNPLKPEGALHLAKMLEINKKIKILDLHNTGILDEGVKYIMESLKQNNILRHIYLDANGLSKISCEYICDYFQYLIDNSIKGLSSLWIDINRLNNDGSIMLSKTLKNYKYLKRLMIGSNRIGPIGCKEICENLVNHPNLKVLDLGFYKSTSDLQELPNVISDNGVPYIVEFILKNKKVQVLSILHNNISIEGLEKINDALEHNDTIVYLYYQQYGCDIPKKLEDSIKNKLAENIKKIYNMEFVDFVNNKLRYIKGSEKLKNIDSIYRNKM